MFDDFWHLIWLLHLHMENSIVLLRRLNKLVRSNINNTADFNELADSLDIDLRETHIAFYQLVGMGYIVNTGIGYICSITPAGILASDRPHPTKNKSRLSPVMAYRQ